MVEGVSSGCCLRKLSASSAGSTKELQAESESSSAAARGFAFRGAVGKVGRVGETFSDALEPDLVQAVAKVVRLGLTWFRRVGKV